jgi:hypothetical protein
VCGLTSPQALLSPFVAPFSRACYHRISVTSLAKVCSCGK